MVGHKGIGAVDYESLATTEKLIGVLVAGSGLLWFLWRRVLKSPMAKFSARVTALLDIPGDVAEMKQQVSVIGEKVSRVEKETRTNDGSSIRDSLLRLEENSHLLIQSFDILLTDSEIAVFKTDETGACVMVNRAFAQLMGRQVEEILGHGWRNCLDKHEAEDVVEQWLTCVTDRREFHRIVRFRKVTNELICARVRAYPVRGVRGGFVGHHAMVKPQECRGCSVPDCPGRQE